MYPIFFLAFAVVATLVHIFLRKIKTFPKMMEVFLMYLIFFNIGLQGIFAAMGHIFMANQIAEQIGWPIGSPFQFEVGFANLSIGIAALMVIFWRGYYWFGPVLAYGIFAYGAAYGHFVQMARGDMSPYNTGIFLYVGDIGITTLYFVLAIYYCFAVLRKTK